jgi:hypothetical protein
LGPDLVGWVDPAIIAPVIHCYPLLLKPLTNKSIVSFASGCAPPPPYAKLARCKQVPCWNGACETRTHHWITGPFWPPKGRHSRVEFVNPQEFFFKLLLLLFYFIFKILLIKYTSLFVTPKTK